MPFDEARKRARILVIEDDPDAFPIELLKAEGYNITHWEAVQSLKPLESGEFDIIVLDIHGIASEEFARSGGLGILRHIKSYNPAQIVIAYSGEKYDFNAGDFWKTADDFLGKPSALTVCKQKIDSLLQSRFSVSYYWRVLSKLLEENDVSQKDILKLERLIIKKSKTRGQISKSELSDVIRLSRESVSIAYTILTVIMKWIAQTDHGQA